jgi:hypothetical protein
VCPFIAPQRKRKKEKEKEKKIKSELHHPSQSSLFKHSVPKKEVNKQKQY